MLVTTWMLSAVGWAGRVHPTRPSTMVAASAGESAVSTSNRLGTALGTLARASQELEAAAGLRPCRSPGAGPPARGL
jgi:hypothetical protein